MEVGGHFNDAPTLPPGTHCIDIWMDLRDSLDCLGIEKLNRSSVTIQPAVWYRSFL
jgi:hypothetical protein